jgi:hypothetical protein
MYEVEFMAAPSLEQMKQFLYGELTEPESLAIEERLFADGEFFYELKGLEDDLVDKYVQGKLSGEEIERFEKSLTKSQARISQIKNARALQRHIAERKNAAHTFDDLETAQRPIQTRLFSLVSLQAPSMQYAMVAVIVLMGITAAWLLYDNVRTRHELTEARSGHAQRIRELEDEIEVSRRQLEALQQQVDEKSGRNEELYRLLQEREVELQRLERELESRRSQNESPAVIAAQITALDNMGGAEPPKVIKSGPRFVRVQLPLLTEAEYENYEIRDKYDKEIATVKQLISRSGKKYLVVILPAKNVEFTVIGVNSETGEKKIIDRYHLDVRQ